jgi:hydroxyethylthiazole kinase-like uncharacterized protein yjeF
MLQPLTASEMKDFEKYAADNFDITIDGMMQNAGRAVFDVVINEIKPNNVLVVAGKGNNGGDALVVARLLKEKGIRVTVLSPYPDDEFTDAVRREFDKVRVLNIPIKIQDSRFKIHESRIMNHEFDLIIDGLFGFSLSGDPKPPADKIIEQINCSSLGSARDDKFIPVLSVDVPSGLDTETGRIMDPAVKATYTVTLGVPKIGLDRHKEYVGKLYLGDVGIPQKAYQKLGIYTPIFLGKTYITLD